MDAAEIIAPLRRMADAMHRECRRIEQLRYLHGRWSVPVTRAECTVGWFLHGHRPVPGDKVPNAPMRGAE